MSFDRCIQYNSVLVFRRTCRIEIYPHPAQHIHCLAKVIEFYVPDRLRERRLWNPPEQHGKVIEFPSKITGVTSQFERCEAAIRASRIAGHSLHSHSSSLEILSTGFDDS
jgi:hypothetical protein